jgi:hypothetical protein
MIRFDDFDHLLLDESITYLILMNLNPTAKTLNRRPIQLDLQKTLRPFFLLVSKVEGCTKSSPQSGSFRFLVN